MVGTPVGAVARMSRCGLPASDMGFCCCSDDAPRWDGRSTDEPLLAPDDWAMESCGSFDLLSCFEEFLRSGFIVMAGCLYLMYMLNTNALQFSLYRKRAQPKWPISVCHTKCGAHCAYKLIKRPSRVFRIKYEVFFTNPPHLKTICFFVVGRCCTNFPLH